MFDFVWVSSLPHTSVKCANKCAEKLQLKIVSIKKQKHWYLITSNLKLISFYKKCLKFVT